MIEKISLTLGRFLLGLYFVLPGISKITGYGSTVSYMELHDIPLVSVLLPVTIILQIGCGLALITGLRIKECALIFVGLTLLINFGMHDFWNEYPNTTTAHELQNFVKNLAILAGLLVLSTTNHLGQWRLFDAHAGDQFIEKIVRRTG